MISGDASLLLTGINANRNRLFYTHASRLDRKPTFEKSLISIIQNKYKSKANRLKDWLDKVCVLKNEELIDGRLDQKKIKLWNALLSEFAEKNFKAAG